MRLNAVVSSRALVGILAGLLTLPSVARAEPIATWTFETDPPESHFDVEVYPDPLPPDFGVGIGSAVHESDESDWTTFVGNGSPEAFSSTVWSVGDYYGFQVSTLGYENIRVGFDMARNNEGPSSFRVRASLDGTNFTTIQNITVLFNDAANGGIWRDGVFVPNYHFGPIALGAAYADKAAVYVRIECLEVGSTITAAVRIDNFSLDGDPLPPIVEALKTDTAVAPPVIPGDTFDYEILVQHAAGSNQDAVDVVIIDDLPDGVVASGDDLVLVRPSGGTVSLTVDDDGDAGEVVGGVVTVRVGELGLLEDALLTIPVRVESRLQPGELENTAEVTLAGSIGGLPYDITSNTLTIDYVACQIAADCPNTNPCVASVACNAGTCVPTFNTAVCDDGDPCTETDTCAGGLCVGGAPPVCDDDNPCTDDTCAPGVGCTSTNDNTNTCDDGNACSLGDLCNAGACIGLEGRVCDDSDPCTVDSCDPATGCAVSDAANGTPCDDGDPATTGDECNAGECQGITIGCTPGQCELTSTPNGEGCDVTFKAPGTACDDGAVGTRDDVCDGAGACAGTAYTCTPGRCEASSVPDGDGCVPTLAAAGTACDDLDACTGGDVCDAVGGCAGTTVTCDAGEVCNATTGACDSLHCTSCDDDAACGGAACVALAGGNRCLVACEDEGDCADGQVCDEHSDGERYCFDATGSGGDCAAPAPEPEVVEPSPEITVQGGACQGGAAGSGAGLALALAGLALVAARMRRAAR